jgi:hypothetical protein
MRTLSLVATSMDQTVASELPTVPKLLQYMLPPAAHRLLGLRRLDATDTALEFPSNGAVSKAPSV